MKPLRHSKTTTLTENWEFLLGDWTPGSEGGNWQPVNVPHTWNAVDALNGGGKDNQSRDGYYRGPGWYRTEVSLPEGIEGQRLFLRFEGVGSVADCHFNGIFLGQHRGAFGAFCFEITDHVNHGGANVLLVRADNTWREDVLPLSGDFPAFGGIYRPVQLIVKDRLCISPLNHASPGVFVTQRDVSRESATVGVRVELDNRGAETSAQVCIAIKNPEGVVLANSSTELQVETQAEVSQFFQLRDPHLWHGRLDPYLHTVEVSVLRDGVVVDSSVQPLGLRFIRIDPEKGFFLNGEPYRLYGVSRHQDKAGKGWALSEQDHAEDLAIVAEIGARGLRTGHYPSAASVYDLCDRLGLLVWIEIPLVDRISSDPNLPANASEQLTEMIRQHFNHPSIFCWGIFNEMYHRESPDAQELIGNLVDLAHSEDPARPTVCAVNKRREDLCRSTDLLALNTYPGWYDGEFGDIVDLVREFNGLGGNRGIAVSEYGAGASIHHHENPPSKPDPNGHWHPEEWQSLFHEATYRMLSETPSCWGSFVWNLFDFASTWREEGGAPGINDKGLVTFDRKTRKDAFYFYKANWSDDPVLYITSRRHTQRSTAVVPLKIYSNADSVTLTINGERIGDQPVGDNRIVVWNRIELRPGENHILVEATRAGQSLTDSCVWNFVPPQARSEALSSEKQPSISR